MENVAFPVRPMQPQSPLSRRSSLQKLSTIRPWLRDSLELYKEPWHADYAFSTFAKTNEPIHEVPGCNRKSLNASRYPAPVPSTRPWQASFSKSMSICTNIILVSRPRLFMNISLITVKLSVHAVMLFSIGSQLINQLRYGCRKLENHEANSKTMKQSDRPIREILHRKLPCLLRLRAPDPWIRLKAIRFNWSSQEGADQCDSMRVSLCKLKILLNPDKREYLSELYHAPDGFGFYPGLVVKLSTEVSLIQSTF